MGRTVVEMSPPIPAGWVDRTMVIHKASAEPSPGLVPNTTVVMDSLAADEDLAQFCSRQVTLFRTSLPEFNLREEKLGILHNRRATRLDFSWQSAVGSLRQQLTLVDMNDGAVLVFTASAQKRCLKITLISFTASLQH